MIDLANKYKLRREITDSSKSVEPMPVFSGTNCVVIDSREGTGSANAMTLASGAIREGAEFDSSQSSKPCLQMDLSSWRSDPSSSMQWG